MNDEATTATAQDTTASIGDATDAQPSSSQPLFIDHDLAYALGRAGDALYAGIAPEVAAAGLSALEWKVLVVLHDMPRGWHVTGIAREVRANHSTIDKLVRRLAQEEIVTIEPDDGDARRLRVKATPQGKRKIKRLMNAAVAHEQALFAQLPAHITAEEFKAALKTITEYASDMAQHAKAI